MKRRDHNTLHLVIRIGGTLQDYNEDPISQDVIKEHNDIAKRRGKSIFGKVGRGLYKSKLTLLKKSIDSGRNVSLIIVRKEKGLLASYITPLHDVNGAGHSPDRSMIPAYYHDLIPHITLWLEIGQCTLLTEKELSRYKLVSNGKQLLDVLSSCRTSLMLVRMEE